MSAPRHLELEHAADAIAEWGFLADPGTSGHLGQGYLITAIRRQPTLEHFDPESVHFWITERDRGVRMAIDRTSPVPWNHELSWGTIRLVDRLREHNDYVTFGGVVVADRLDDTTVVILLSSVPLFRRGGHSQGWDPGAQSAAAFLARLAAAAGASREVEAAIARADAVTRYAAFLAEDAGRRASSRFVTNVDAASTTFLRAEARRIQRSEPTRWAAGQDLAGVVASASVPRSPTPKG